jgi:hypothetical protein
LPLPTSTTASVASRGTWTYSCSAGPSHSSDGASSPPFSALPHRHSHSTSEAARPVAASMAHTCVSLDSTDGSPNTHTRFSQLLSYLPPRFILTHTFSGDVSPSASRFASPSNSQRSGAVARSPAPPPALPPSPVEKLCSAGESPPRCCFRAGSNSCPEREPLEIDENDDSGPPLLRVPAGALRFCAPPA